MSAIESLVAKVAALPQLHAVLHATYVFLLPPFLRQRAHGHAAHGAVALPFFALTNIERIVQSYIWFLAMGLVLYALLTTRNLLKERRFSYVLLNRQPGQKFSLWSALRYLLPTSLYGHRSVKIDLMYWPFSVVLNFFGLLSATIGVGAVQIWLLHHLGHSPLTIFTGASAIVLQVIIVLLARDFGRFMWHWQGHVVPFFWEFHKGHHAVEVLHPFFIRTHPVDMFIRNAYTGVGGGLIGGALIYLLGMKTSVVSLSWAASFTAVMDMLQWFEHSHVPISFGKTLNRFFYAPYMHHVHHGAALEHMNKNLGITGGLILWDRLFGTLYWPTPGEKIVWGASMEELGANNPHRTLWGFISGPFIAAYLVLRGRNPSPMTQSLAEATVRGSAS